MYLFPHAWNDAMTVSSAKIPRPLLTDILEEAVPVVQKAAESSGERFAFWRLFV